MCWPGRVGKGLDPLSRAGGQLGSCDAEQHLFGALAWCVELKSDMRRGTLRGLFHDSCLHCDTPRLLPRSHLHPPTLPPTGATINKRLTCVVVDCCVFRNEPLYSDVLLDEATTATTTTNVNGLVVSLTPGRN